MAKSEAKPIFWISGNYYDVRQKWKQVLSLYDGEVKVETFDCGYNSDSIPDRLRCPQIGDVINLLKNTDMFDDRARLFRLIGCPPDYTILNDYLHLIDNSNAVVFTCPAGYYVPSGASMRFVTAKISGLYKQIKSWGHAFEFPEDADTDREAIQWVQRVAKEIGKPIEDEAASFLVENRGRNLDRLYGDLQKISDYQYEAKKITQKMVEEVCIPIFTRTTWDFIDALDTCDFDACIEHLLKFFEIAGNETGSSFYGDVLSLLTLVRHHFQFLVMVKSGCSKALSFDGAAKAVKGFLKRERADGQDKWTRDVYEYGYLKMNMSKQSVLQALNWNSGRLHTALVDLDRCGLFCRVNSGDESAIRQAVTTFVLHACGKISFDDAEYIRGPVLDFYV